MYLFAELKEISLTKVFLLTLLLHLSFFYFYRFFYFNQIYFLLLPSFLNLPNFFFTFTEFLKNFILVVFYLPAADAHGSEHKLYTYNTVSSKNYRTIYPKGDPEGCFKPPGMVWYGMVCVSGPPAWGAGLARLAAPDGRQSRTTAAGSPLWLATTTTTTTQGYGTTPSRTVQTHTHRAAADKIVIFQVIIFLWVSNSDADQHYGRPPGSGSAWRMRNRIRKAKVAENLLKKFWKLCCRGLNRPGSIRQSKR